MREPPASIPNRKQDGPCGLSSLRHCPTLPPSPSPCSPWRSGHTADCLLSRLLPPSSPNNPAGPKVSLFPSFLFLPDSDHPFLKHYDQIHQALPLGTLKKTKERKKFRNYFSLQKISGFLVSCFVADSNIPFEMPEAGYWPSHCLYNSKSHMHRRLITCSCDAKSSDSNGVWEQSGQSQSYCSITYLFADNV